MTSVLTRDRKGEVIGTEEGHMKTKVRFMQPQIKEYPEPPDARAFCGAWYCRHLDFRLLASTIVRDYISVVLSHQDCGNLLQQI